MEIAREHLARECGNLKAKGFDYLKKITAIDTGSEMTAIYILYGTESKKEEVLSVKLSYQDPEIGTVMHIYPAADWYEREMAEMFGIRISGRKTEPLLLEEWNGDEAPLRKSFAWGKGYRKRA